MLTRKMVIKKMLMRKTLMRNATLFLLLSLALLPRAATTRPQAAPDEIKTFTHTGEQMPDFSFTTLGGKPSKLSDLKGKVVFVNFWATWCPPCRVEMPRMEKEIWRRYKSSPDFFMVAVAREQTESEIAPFAKENGYTFPLASDPHREVFRLFGSGGIPRSYVVGRDGRILFQSMGYTAAEFEELKKVIDRELSKTQGAQVNR